MRTERRTDIHVHDKANSRFSKFCKSAKKNMSGKISDFSLSRTMKEFGVATTIIIIIIIIIIILCFCYRYLDYAG
jgi:hypothetical protein